MQHIVDSTDLAHDHVSLVVDARVAAQEIIGEPYIERLQAYGEFTEASAPATPRHRI